MTETAERAEGRGERPGESCPRYPFPPSGPLDPPPEWARLREGSPAARVRMASGDETVLLTRYADVRGVLADSRFGRELHAPDAARISSSSDGGVFNREGGPDEGEHSITRGDGHKRWRRLLNRSFTPKRVTALQPRIEEIAEELLDEMLAGGSPADLVASLGFPLPVYVICKLLGIPAVDRDRFAHWSDAMLSLTKHDQAEIDRSGREFTEYMAAHVAEKRANPGDDLLSELAEVVDAHDGRMSEAELIGTGRGLLAAGHETTATMIGKMVAMLLVDRRRWDELLADPSLVRTAVEEMLRFDPNFGHGLPRYLSEEVDVADTTLPAGTTVIADMGAANRDERAFECPAEMDFRRSPNPHLAFGVGASSCLGQHLARTELQTVLSVLLRRLPSLALAVDTSELCPREGLLLGGFEELPVRW
jgi:cytochrome P450